MDKKQITDSLLNRYPEILVFQNSQYPEVNVPASTWHNVALELKNRAEYAFDYLFCLSGIDDVSHFTVVYHLESTTHRHQLVVKVNTASREKNSIDSVSDIWQTAEYQEREVYDLLGVEFTSHPDLRRLFLEDGWGFPLRKDYKDEINIIER